MWKTLASGLLLVALPCSTQAADITVNAGLAGKTPEIVGYNSGNYMPGSNTTDWWRYSGVNGARVWATPNTVEPTDDGNGWGDGVSSEPTFVARLFEQFKRTTPQDERLRFVGRVRGFIDDAAAQAVAREFQGHR